jgi:hypothetical protein
MPSWGRTGSYTGSEEAASVGGLFLAIRPVAPIWDDGPWSLEERTNRGVGFRVRWPTLLFLFDAEELLSRRNDTTLVTFNLCGFDLAPRQGVGSGWAVGSWLGNKLGPLAE